MTRRAQTGFRPSVEQFDSRVLPSVNNTFMSGTIWVAQCNNTATSLTVTESGSNYKLTDTASNQTWLKPKAQVSKVELQGGTGNDRFVDYVSTLPVRFYGGGGNDYLEGYDGADYMQGDGGNDTLVGYGGNDTLFGGTGDDLLKGMAGNDQLVGDAGEDHLNGGAGTDSCWGGNDDDVIINLDNGTGDYSEGGAGRDAIWVDGGESAVGNTSGDRLNAVGSFVNGADRTLDGDRIADPTAKSGHSYKRFSGNPLFPTGGPRMDDVRQGNLGDCWLLAELSALAMDGEHALTSSIVDFDDGTYGVRFVTNSGANRFYRVDDDLPVASASASNPVYAQLGAERSMWVAVAEKAYTHFRTGANSYASIEGGWSLSAARAFGTTSGGAKDISGSSGYANATALANDLYNRWNTYQAVTVGILSRPSGVPLVAEHMYTVARFVRNSSGAVTGIVLRNPWGTDGAGNDGANDGYVTLTPAQLFSCTGRVNWGRV